MHRIDFKRLKVIGTGVLLWGAVLHADVRAVMSGGLTGEISLLTVGNATPGAVFTGSGDTGSDVAAGGDFNGDGLADVVIGTYSTNRTYVIYGQSGGNALAGTINVSSVGSATPGVKFIPGFVGSSAGDFNGDGVDDLIVGTESSGCYVIYGKAGGAALSGTVNLADVGVTIPGAFFKITNPAYASSQSVASAGDVNGDGVDDILIGTGFTERQVNAFVGRSYLIYGVKGGGALTGTIDLQSVGSTVAGATFVGQALGDVFGRSVSAAGDVNGDGVDDFVIGAPQGWAVGTQNPGKAYLVYGQTGNKQIAGTFNATQIGSSISGAIFTGAHPGALLGESVSGHGDFNGDGLEDMIFGAQATASNDPNRAGEAVVVFGRAGANQLTGAISLQSLGGTLKGLEIPASATVNVIGTDVSAAGDFNGDGLDDILVSSPYATANGQSSAGVAAVVYGRGNLDQNSSVDLDQIAGGSLPGAIFRGVGTNNLAGWTASWVGDMNGDGVTDLMIGAAGTGTNYLIYGQRAVPEPNAAWLALLCGMGAALCKARTAAEGQRSRPDKSPGV